MHIFFKKDQHFCMKNSFDKEMNRTVEQMLQSLFIVFQFLFEKFNGFLELALNKKKFPLNSITL